MKMTPLNIPCPPNLEDALGYAPAEKERYVGFYWIPCGDEFMFSDGFLTAGGCWQGFQVFAYHPRVKGELAPYNFGDADREASHYLILDRVTRTLYVADAEDAQKFLAENSRDDDHVVSTLSPEAQRMYADMIINAFLSQPSLTVAQIAQRMSEIGQKADKLRDWLDQQP